MRNLAFSLMLCLAGVALCSADDEGNAALQSLRAANAASAAAVRSLIVEEVVAVFHERGADEEAAFRQRHYAAYDKLTEGMIEYLRHDSTTSEEETRAAVEAVRDKRDGAQVEGFMQAWKLNGEQLYRQRTTVDFTTGRWRVETRDLRDLDAIAGEHQLTALDRQNVDVSKTLVGCPDYGLIINGDESLCAVDRPRSYNTLEKRLKLLGIVPERLLRGQFEVSVEGEGAPAGVNGKWAGTDAVAFVVRLEPDSGARFSRMARYRQSGERTEEILASDYRDVAGAGRIPFQTLTISARRADSTDTIELRAVTSIEINTEISGAAFDPPGAIKLQELDHQAMKAFAEHQRIVGASKP
jgi:hypothetical protein